MDYTPIVKNYVIENFLFGDGNNLNKNTSFLQSGIIDSTGILELITFLEESFSIAIQDSELVPENLDSLNNIEKFLKYKLKEGQE